MSSLGHKLAAERERRGASLEALAERSGVGRAYLEALEREEFDSLPGRAFGKFYIRVYAEQLGFDPSPLLAEYDELTRDGSSSRVVDRSGELEPSPLRDGLRGALRRARQSRLARREAALAPVDRAGPGEGIAAAPDGPRAEPDPDASAADRGVSGAPPAAREPAEERTLDARTAPPGATEDAAGAETADAVDGFPEPGVADERAEPGDAGAIERADAGEPADAHVTEPPVVSGESAEPGDADAIERAGAAEPGCAQESEIFGHPGVDPAAACVGTDESMEPVADGVPGEAERHAAAVDASAGPRPGIHEPGARRRVPSRAFIGAGVVVVTAALVALVVTGRGSARDVARETQGIVGEAGVGGDLAGAGIRPDADAHSRPESPGAAAGAASAAGTPTYGSAAGPAGASPVAEKAPARAPAASSSLLGVSEHGVGRAVRDRRLVGAGTAFVEGSEVVFLTRVVGGRSGDVVRHVWLRGGRPVQTITLRVGGAHWRTHSIKTAWGVGSWAVEARDASGAVLARSSFEITPRVR